jgi:acyl-CoA synthetase (AMP-forming)/AMP-acid ligase II
MNIVDPILFQCRRQPPAAAICVPSSDIGLISYRRLEHFIHNIARRLHALGLKERSIVAVDIDNAIFHAAVVLALIRLGMATVSLREGAAVLPMPIEALITTPDRPLAFPGRTIVADLSWTEGDGQPIEPHLLPQTQDHDVCRIILTSGTTNVPKAVALNHKQLASRIHRHLSVFGNRLGNCERIYSDVPISSSLGFQFLVYALWRGGTAFFPGETFAETLRVFEEYKVQCVVGSPGGFENLVRGFDTVPSYQSDVEVVFCGGDVLSRSLSDRLRSRICTHVVAAYGSTETSMSAAAHAHEIAEMPRAVGFVTPGVKIQIVDESGTIRSPGEEGSVRISSEYAVDSYFGSPEETIKAFRNGWFYPGDVGTLNSDGLLTITAREQSVLNLGGDKISPESIELILTQFKGVEQAAVATVPNEYGNDEIYAMVVSRHKADEGALRAHCEALLPRSFMPAKFLFPDSLPRNEMGKIDRRQLRMLIG